MLVGTPKFSWTVWVRVVWSMMGCVCVCAIPGSYYLTVSGIGTHGCTSKYQIGSRFRGFGIELTKTCRVQLFDDYSILPMSAYSLILLFITRPHLEWLSLLRIQPDVTITHKPFRWFILSGRRKKSPLMGHLAKFCWSTITHRRPEQQELCNLEPVGAGECTCATT
jgi:hypothetical protein